MFSLPLHGLYHFIPWIKGCPLVPGWNLWPCCGSASQRPRDWTRGRYLSLGASKYWSKGWCTTFDGFWCRDFCGGMSSILRQCLHTVIHDFESYSILSWCSGFASVASTSRGANRTPWEVGAKTAGEVSAWKCGFGGCFGDVSRMLSNVMECSSISITIYIDVYV